MDDLLYNFIRNFFGISNNPVRDMDKYNPRSCNCTASDRKAVLWNHKNNLSFCSA